MAIGPSPHPCGPPRNPRNTDITVIPLTGNQVYSLVIPGTPGMFTSLWLLAIRRDTRNIPHDLDPWKRASTDHRDPRNVNTSVVPGDPRDSEMLTPCSSRDFGTLVISKSLGSLELLETLVHIISP